MRCEELRLDAYFETLSGIYGRRTLVWSCSEWWNDGLKEDGNRVVSEQVIVVFCKNAIGYVDLVGVD